jgi:hypothetical protein
MKKPKKKRYENQRSYELEKTYRYEEIEKETKGRTKKTDLKTGPRWICPWFLLRTRLAPSWRKIYEIDVEWSGEEIE